MPQNETHPSKPNLPLDALIKLAADKIIQLLAKVYNSPLSDKRWVWELMQNAKDCPNKFGRVSVEIHLYQDKLVFKHNGDCFSDRDFVGLALQVSSKDSTNEDNKVGKFGTGFITTHLLSKVIDVEGIVFNSNAEKYQQFSIRLDRSARKSEELIPNINEIIGKIYDMDNFPIAEGYENRKENSFDTSFTYPLEDEDAARSAKIGLDDLVNTLPITMVSIPQIKSVFVENHISGEKQKYVCNTKTLLKEEDREIMESCVKINEEKELFLTYKTLKKLEDGSLTPNVGLSIETIIAKDGKYELVARDKGQPVLFRDFPLIGSEEFYFPYVLNGYDFDPTEMRDGILLNGNEPGPKKNRAIIEDAIQAVLSFNEWLISQGTRNTYLMAASYEPKPVIPWDEIYAKPWINGQMGLWHEALLKQKLIETPNGYVELSQMKLPDYGGKEANRKFYEFLSDFKIYCLPLREQQDEWANVLSWARNNKFSKDAFFKQLENVRNVSALSERLEKSDGETYEWLNGLYKFMTDQQDMEQLNRYAIIPNQSGNFCLLKSLMTDSGQRIPEEIKDIAGTILREDLREELLAENIDSFLFSNMREYNLDNLIHNVNKIIKETTERRISVLSGEWERVSKCVYDIIALHTNDDEEEQKREKMRKFVSHFADGMSGGSHIDNLPTSLWEEADKFVISYVPYLIEQNAKTLSELGGKLLCCPEEHDEERCIDWLNDFNEILDSYGMRVPEAKYIYPNQSGVLMPLTKLHYDKGIPSELIDLNVTANNEDWREKLLDRRITGHETQDPLGTADIYKEISGKFANRYTDEQKKFEIAREAITLCPDSKTGDSDNISTIYGFLKKIDADLPECKAIENSSDFYWEIFVAHILRKVCERISTAVNISGLSDLIDENEDESVNYVDSILEYAMNCYGNRYQKYVTDEYGLWTNQNGDFCMFGDISKDDNIDEEVKDIAKNPIVGIDYRERLLRNDMKCECFVSSAITTKDILNEINAKIYEYVEEDKRNLQEGNFTGLVAALMIAIKKHPDYSSSLMYFVQNKDKLFVGSIGDDETLSLFSSIASTPERKELFTKLDKFSNEELQKIVDGEYGSVIVIDGTGEEISDGKKEAIKELTKLSEEKLEEIVKEADPKKALKELTAYYDKLPINTDCDYDATLSVGGDTSLSEEKKREYCEEAKGAVLKKLKEDGFDTSAACGGYSIVNGVKKGGIEYPLVIKSYRNFSYSFKINPNEWIQLNKSNSMLLIYTGSEIGKVTFSNLFRNQDNMSIQFSLEALGDTRNVWRFAEILKYFKECHFDFSNLAVSRYESMSMYRLGQNNPNAFLDLSSDDKNLID